MQLQNMGMMIMLAFMQTVVSSVTLYKSSLPLLKQRTALLSCDAYCNIPNNVNKSRVLSNITLKHAKRKRSLLYLSKENLLQEELPIKKKVLHTITIDALLQREKVLSPLMYNVDDALEECICCDSITGIRLLVQQGVDLAKANKQGYLPIHIAAKQGHIRSIAELLKAGAQKDACVTQGKCKGMIALHIATLKNHTKAVEFLLNAKANMCIQLKKNQRTPLHNAAQAGYTELVRLFLKNRVYEDVRDNDDNTPLHLATKNGHGVIVTELIKAGAKIDLVDKHGFTALHLAVQQRVGSVVMILLQANAHLEALDKESRTPLYNAVIKGDGAVVRVLLQASAKTNMRDKEGKTLLHKAACRGDEAIVAALLEFSVDVHAVDNDKKTPLHEAAQNGHEAVVALLLNAGARENSVDTYGFTPLDLATKKGYGMIVDMFISGHLYGDAQGSSILFDQVQHTWL